MSDHAISSRLDDLLPIYSGLCSIPGIIAAGRIQHANEQLDIVLEYAKSCRGAAYNAYDLAGSEVDKNHFLTVHGLIGAVCRLLYHAIHKITTGRAGTAGAQLDAARAVARTMMQVALAHEGNIGGANALH